MPTTSIQHRGVTGCFVSKMSSQDWTQCSSGEGKMSGSWQEKDAFLTSTARNLFGLIVFLLRLGVVVLPLLLCYQNIATPPKATEASFMRMHAIHPEPLIQCLDCKTMVEGLEYGFKDIKPGVCRNPVYDNRSRFLLDAKNPR